MLKKSNRFQAVILDMDGTIVMTEPLHAEAWNTVLARHGCVPSSPDWGDAFIGLTEEACRETVCTMWPHLRGVPDLIEEKETAFRRMVRDGAGRDLTTPGIRDGLSALREAGVRLAVATNSETENATLVLKASGLAEFFSIVVTSDMVERGKPFPDVYQAAAAALQVSPGVSASVEDSLAGLTASRKAGCFTIGVTNTLPAERLEPVDRVFSSTEAALSWLAS